MNVFQGLVVREENSVRRELLERLVGGRVVPHVMVVLKLGVQPLVGLG